MRLVIVSNRLPFTVSFPEGSPQFKPSAGGLTTGLWSYLDRKALDGAESPDYLQKKNLLRVREKVSGNSEGIPTIDFGRNHQASTGVFSASFLP